MRTARTLAGWLGLALLWLPACSTDARTAPETIEAYLEAVQSEDFRALFCLSAGAREAEELGDDESGRRSGFESWARAEYDRYREGRDRGFIELDGEAIPLVKLFSLGRGAFYTYQTRQSAGEGSLVVRTTIRFGYPQVNLSRLSPGTTFYLSGVPVGRVHAVQVPAGPREVRVEVMDTVAVEWGLTRAEAGAGCAAGWTVVSALPVEGSATATDVTWLF